MRRDKRTDLVSRTKRAAANELMPKFLMEALERGEAVSSPEIGVIYPFFDRRSLRLGFIPSKRLKMRILETWEDADGCVE